MDIVVIDQQGTLSYPHQTGQWNDIALPLLTPFPAPVIQISQASLYHLYLDVEGRVWGAGANVDGPLGLGLQRMGKEHVFYPPILLSVPVTIRQVATARSWALLLDHQGVMWKSGFSRQQRSQLGREEDATFQPVILEVPICYLTALRDGCAALASDNSVWAYGPDSILLAKDGRLGNTFIRVSSPSPARLVSLHQGIGALYALDSAHTLWFLARGANWYKIREQAKAISVSDSTILLLDMEGRIWASGDSSGGRLGLSLEDCRRQLAYDIIDQGQFDSNQHQRGNRAYFMAGRLTHDAFAQVILPHPVVQVLALPYHSLLLDSQKVLWGCGSNSKGQLGLPLNLSCVRLPQPLPVGSNHQIRGLATISQLGCRTKNARAVN